MYQLRRAGELYPGLALLFDFRRESVRLFVPNALLGTVWRDLLPTMCEEYAALHRSAQCSKPYRVPMQGRCAEQPTVLAFGTRAQGATALLTFCTGYYNRNEEPGEVLPVVCPQRNARLARRSTVTFGFAGL